ncbi:hypothetical protein [Pseudonocardia sp. ICBG1293]|uniref:hypothetical protein n=1 Tax=Pseudonocardia sp. ICBG1293 TaxID=2844382 RepID=UPI001CCC60A9|nr:hypothetical protein [Pseudonocardia sp. ICBG1293]
MADRPAPRRGPALDLLDSGVLRHGTDVRDGAVRPTHDELVRGSAQFLVDRVDDHWLAGVADPAALLALGASGGHQDRAVPGPVPAHAADRGGSVATRPPSASYDGPHAGLATGGAGLGHRPGRGAGRGLVAALTDDTWPGFHTECVEAHLRALPGDDPTVTGLRALRDALAVLSPSRAAARRTPRPR